MPSSQLPLTDCLETAVTAAHAAAAILQAHAHRRADLVISTKQLNDLVSQADHEAEEAILDILRERTPSLGIVAEESGGEPAGKASWYIDPLDGTTNFLHGLPHYAVSIALVAHPGAHVTGEHMVDRDTPVIAVIYDPVREELFTAMHGVGAWVNNTRIRCSNTPVLAESVLATGFPFRDFSFEDQYNPMLRQAMHSTRGVRRMGSAALDLAWVACGRFDGYWEMGLAPWDVAAGTLLVREAGGVCEDMHHTRPWPHNGALYAANAHIAPQLNNLIQAHL
ncbi:MAG TPA: inositol monophosphatase family protein [Burkholderiaceae bacterium]|nr:inositol monophosphatase family protein [Burkholderiaceae bacterium]